MKFQTTFLLFLSLTLTLILTASSIVAEDKNAAIPNVLFIMVDEMRADALGVAAKDSPYQTPTLDRLAAEGVRFSQAYTVAAVCVSSRYSFFTSRYSHVHGAVNNNIKIREPQILLPSIMKKLGYETAISGKLHFSPNNLDYDFDYFWSFSSEGPKKLQTWPQYLAEKYKPAERKVTEQPFPGHRLGGDLGKLTYPQEDTQSSWITDRAVEFFSLRDKSKPFFLFVSYLEPHSPSHLAEPYWSQYLAEKEKVKLSPTFVPNREPASEDEIERRGRGWVSDPNIAKAMTAAYHIKVKAIDDNIKRLLDGLKKAELEEDTLVIFTSDHGNMLGDHNRWFKGVTYDGSSRIPLIFKAPKSSAYAKTFNNGKTVDKLVESIDVAPTLLEIIGKPLPDDPGFQGKSLVRLAAGDDSDWENVVFSERTGMFVRAGQYKFVRYDRDNGTIDYQLFDLKDDPLETKNLIHNAELKSVVDDLKQKLETWQNENPDVPKYHGLEPKFSPEDT
ncbi:MAG: sulfatase-like hydrolase/transferase [Planctomycetaceae bacterium]|jgi:arylsulfatase A-like enzyme|nr:sulfatase-like hydrolase/transferase [Planctomycetaceae bacterium]